MIATPAVVNAPAAGAVSTREAPSEWRIARALARKDAWRLLRVTSVPAVLFVLLNFGGPDLLHLRAHSINLAFNALLLAAITLIASHRAVTRDRRYSADELTVATAASERARTAGHLLAVAAPTLLAVALVVLVTAIATAGATTIGELVVWELAVGPLLVAGAGCLGVLLARVLPHAITPFVACFLIALFELGVNTPALAGSGWRWFTFWVEGSFWYLLPRHSTAHAVYLAGLVALAALAALLRHGMTRRLTIVSVVAFAVTGAAGAAQLRQPSDHWREVSLWFADPPTVQHCEVADGVRYCTFPGFEELTSHFRSLADDVRDVVPRAAWPGELAITQRASRVDLQYAGSIRSSLTHLPDFPKDHRKLRPPDDGDIHPPIEWGWSPIEELGVGTYIAAKVTGLPVVPGEGNTMCSAAGQARGLLALWLAAHAGGGDGVAGLQWLLDRAEQAGIDADDDARALLPIADVEIYGGFLVSLGEARAVLTLLEQHDDAVTAATVRRHWNTLTDPLTSSSEAGQLLGVSVPAFDAKASQAVIANADPGIVSTHSACA